MQRQTRPRPATRQQPKKEAKLPPPRQLSLQQTPLLPFYVSLFLFISALHPVLFGVSCLKAFSAESAAVPFLRLNYTANCSAWPDRNSSLLRQTQKYINTRKYSIFFFISKRRG
jgi:hypothetical protein